MVERILRLAIILILVLSGCKSRGQGSSGASRSASGFLSPEAPTSSTPIKTFYRAPRGSKIIWYVNGVEVAEDVTTLDTSLFKGGDTVTAVVELPDGSKKEIGKVVVSKSIPTIHSLLISPQRPLHGQDVGVVYEASDPDGDKVTLDIDWYINGKKVYTGDKLPGDMIKPGDVITCKARPFDGSLYGSYRASMNSAVVQNTPPKFVSKPGRFDGKVFKMPIVVHDPDGDSVSIKILKAPSGSVVRNDTFFFEYKGDTAAAFPVVIEARDSWGGVAKMNFAIKVKKKKTE